MSETRVASDTPDEYGRIARYFLQFGGAEEIEVSKEAWVGAERAAGFHNTMGRPTEPGTGGFGTGWVRGRISYERPGVVDLGFGAAVETVYPSEPTS